MQCHVAQYFELFSTCRFNSYRLTIGGALSTSRGVHQQPSPKLIFSLTLQWQLLSRHRLKIKLSDLLPESCSCMRRFKIFELALISRNRASHQNYAQDLTTLPALENLASFFPSRKNACSEGMIPCT